MKLNKSLAIATLGIAALTLFSSCQDEDFGYTAQQIKTSKFAQNFENQYGPIDPDQSWDLTNYMTRTAKYDDEALVDYLLQNGGQTRAGDGSSDPIGSLPDNCGLAIDEDGYYHVEPNTIKWLRSFLKEKKNNTDLGSAFSLRSPGNKVAIIPIYQGFANMDWSLWLRRTGANAGDTKLWTESQNIMVSNDDGSTWSEKGTTYGTSQTVYDLAIKSKPIVIDLQEGENFNLFLQIDNNNNQDTFAKTGTIQLSSMGMMLALPCPLPENLGKTNGKDNLAMIVGVEDSDLEESDWDMNDVCFLIVGLPNLPNRVDITRKRYMCEDLGNTYDFDFNDIVVDVMEVQTSEYNATTNLFKPVGNPTQIATMKHVCGTLPFKVKVGETWFNQVTDPTDENKTKAELAADVNESDIVNLPTTRAVNWNPEFSRRITGWKHNENNIEILVSTETNKNIDVLTDAFGDKNGAIEIDRDKHIYHITFAERGEAPLIIATDPTLMWMEEHQNIPDSWWKEGAFKPTGSADNDAPADGGHTTDEWKEIPETLVKLDDAGNAVIWEGPKTFTNYDGLQIQTDFLDAVFEGYTVLEVQFANENGDFFFKKVGLTEWEDYFKKKDDRFEFSNHTFTYSLSPSQIKDLVLGIVIEESHGGELTINKVIMKKPQTYTLTVNDGDHGTVSVDVPANSDGKYTEGTVVTVTATPKSGWYFDQWSDGNVANPRTVTVSADLEITAQYTDQEPTYLWKGTAECNSWGDNPTATLDFKSQTYEVGDKLVFKADKRDGAGLNIAFNNWNYKADGADGRPKPTETADGYELTLNQEMVNALNSNKTIIFNGNNVTIYQVDLVKPASYTINVASADAAQGSVEIVGKDGTSFTGTGTVQLKATPATGYKFASWTAPSGTSTDNPLSVTLSETVDGQTYTANFEEAAKYTVTIAPGDNGKISVNGTEYTSAFTATDVYEGTTYSIEAIPNEGYDFDAWTTIGGSASQTITVNSDINTTANFKIKTFTLTLEATNGGMYKVDGGDPVASYTQTYDYNTSVTVEAVSNDSEAYSFNGWEDGVTTEERTFTMTENKTAKAKFGAAGAVSIFSGSKTMNNWGNAEFTPDAKNEIINAINEGKRTMVINFSSCETTYDMYLQTTWSNKIGSPESVTVSTTTSSASFTFEATDSNKINQEGLKIMIKENSSTNAGANIVISSIVMQ